MQEKSMEDPPKTETKTDQPTPYNKLTLTFCNIHQYSK